LKYKQFLSIINPVNLSQSQLADSQVAHQAQPWLSKDGGYNPTCIQARDSSHRYTIGANEPQAWRVNVPLSALNTQGVGSNLNVQSEESARSANFTSGMFARGLSRMARLISKVILGICLTSGHIEVDITMNVDISLKMGRIRIINLEQLADSQVAHQAQPWQDKDGGYNPTCIQARDSSHRYTIGANEPQAWRVNVSSAERGL
jgi:hypothetical protein